MSEHVFECATRDGSSVVLCDVAEPMGAYYSGGRVFVMVCDPNDDGCVALSAQDARRMGEALIEMAKANGA